MTTINWSGYDWNIKTGYGLGPGPNNWSDDPNDVYVDSQGNLHLNIAYRNGTWYCTEIVSTSSFGYGTFKFNVAPISYLDSNAVFGMFTYSDDCHEIDIEYSKWGNSQNVTNAGFTVQPQEACTNPYGNIYNQYNTNRINIPLNQPTSNYFTWVSSNVHFSNTSSTTTTWDVNSPTYIPQYPTSIPTNVRLNLWLYKGTPPSIPQEVIINSFQFTETPPSQTSCSGISLLGKCITTGSLAIIGGIGLVSLIVLIYKRD